MAKHFVCSLRNFNQESNKSAAFIVKKTLLYPHLSFNLALSEKITSFSRIETRQFINDMKKILLILCILSTLFNGFCQTIGKQYDASAKFKPASVKQYNYWVNQAELAICDSNFQRASDCYDEAFTCHLPFRKDAIFAFRVNTEFLRNTDRAFICIYALIRSGEEPADFIDDTIKDADLYQTAKTLYLNCKKTIIPDLHDEMEDILTSDQAVRKNSFCSADDKELERMIDSVDYNNLQRIQQLYKKYPLVNVYTAGIAVEHLDLVFRHNAYKRGFPLSKTWYKEVRKGNLNVRDYMQTSDLCNASAPCKKRYDEYARQNIYQIGNTLFILTPDNLKKIHRNRHKVFCAETWEETVKKAKYVYSEQCEFYFFPRSNLATADPETDARNLREKIDKGEVKGEYIILN